MKFHRLYDCFQIAINESAKFIARKPGEEYLNDGTKFGEKEEIYIYDSSILFPESGGRFESKDAMLEFVSNYFGLDSQDIDDGSVGKLGGKEITINYVANIVTGNMRAAMAIILLNPDGKTLSAVLKYFTSMGSSGQNKWNDNDLAFDTGLTRSSGRAFFETVPIKATSLVKDYSARDPLELLDRVVASAEEMAKSENVSKMYSEHISQIADSVRSNSPFPVLKGAYKYAPVYAKYIGEILQPISVCLGWNVTGQIRESENELIKVFNPSLGYGAFKIRFPQSAQNTLVDSELIYGNENDPEIQIGISSKSGVGAASSTKALYKILFSDDQKSEMIDDIKSRYPKVSEIIDIIERSSAIIGPLQLAVNFGIIDEKEFRIVQAMFKNMKGTTSPVFIRAIKSDKRIFTKNLVDLSALLGGKSFIDIISSKNYSETYNPAYHILAGIAKQVSNVINKSREFSDATKMILNASSMIQIYSNVKKVNGKDLTFDKFDVKYPPNFSGKVMITSAKTYYSNKIKGKLGFVLKK